MKIRRLKYENEGEADKFEIEVRDALGTICQVELFC